ncbi:Tafazzin family protein [Plasmodiophora brassicae]
MATASLGPWPALPSCTTMGSPTILDDILTTMVTSVTGGIARVFMTRLNTTRVESHDVFLKAVTERPANRGLVTVSNHVSALDDPLTIASMTPLRVLLNTRGVRWGLCATDRCFHNAVLARFVSKGKVLPIARGRGMYQQGMQDALDRLDHGDWVHVFPEGTRSKTGEILPLKSGVGRLICDAKVTPVVVPYYHEGMQRIMSRGSARLGVGQTVNIVVGEPIDFDDIFERFKGCTDRTALYEAVTERIAQRLSELRNRASEQAL